MKRYLDQRLKLQLLRVLDALAVHGSLLKASTALGVSQPALTKSLKDLEEIVGTQLFERHARGVRPTQAGTLLLLSGRRVLAEVKRMDEYLDLLGNPFGGLAAVGVLPVAASGLAAMVVNELRKKNANFMVRIEQGRTEELLPLLASGQLDLVIGRLYENGPDDSFRKKFLWNDPIAVIAHPDHRVFLGTESDLDFNEYDVILPGESQRVAPEVSSILSSLDFESSRIIWSSSYDFTRELLLSTDAIAIAPPLVVLGDIRRGHLRAMNLPTKVRQAGILTVDGRPLGRAAVAFIECLEENLHAMLSDGKAPIAGFALSNGD